MQRYFIDELNHGVVQFKKEDAHHILNVLRMKTNDRVEVVFDKKLYIARITSLNPLNAIIENEIADESELKNDITLYYCLVKGEKLDLVIQKAVELGVNSIVLLNSKRTIVTFKDVDKKLNRFQQIIKGAAEQSHRLFIPNIKGVYDLRDLNITSLKDHNFIAYELNKGKQDTTFNYFNEIKENESISILIGPEGGFDPKEVEHVNKLGFKNISLGSRILRSETAAIACLAQLSFILESKKWQFLKF